LTNIFAILCSHGTAVSGIIAGLKGNNICTVGVAYNASLLGKIPMNNVAKQTFENGALDSQPQVIKFTSCSPMIGGSLRVLHDIAEILLKVALKHKKSNQMFA
jgi:hypothetical protein